MFEVSIYFFNFVISINVLFVVAYLIRRAKSWAVLIFSVSLSSPCGFLKLVDVIPSLFARIFISFITAGVMYIVAKANRLKLLNVS